MRRRRVKRSMKNKGFINLLRELWGMTASENCKKLMKFTNDLGINIDWYALQAFKTLQGCIGLAAPTFPFQVDLARPIYLRVFVLCLRNAKIEIKTKQFYSFNSPIVICFLISKQLLVKECFEFWDWKNQQQHFLHRHDEFLFKLPVGDFLTNVTIKKKKEPKWSRSFFGNFQGDLFRRRRKHKVVQTKCCFITYPNISLICLKQCQRWFGQSLFWRFFTSFDRLRQKKKLTGDLWTLKSQKSSPRNRMFKGLLNEFPKRQFRKNNFNFDVIRKMKAQEKKNGNFCWFSTNSRSFWLCHHEFGHILVLIGREGERKRVRVRETKENNISLCKKLSGAINNS